MQKKQKLQILSVYPAATAVSQCSQINVQHVYSGYRNHFISEDSFCVFMFLLIKGVFLLIDRLSTSANWSP